MRAMALVDNDRNQRQGDACSEWEDRNVGHSASETDLPPSLLAKAAIVLGLPNLVASRPVSGDCARRRHEGPVNGLLLRPDSRCSCVRVPRGCAIMCRAANVPMGERAPPTATLQSIASGSIEEEEEEEEEEAEEEDEVKEEEQKEEELDEEMQNIESCCSDIHARISDSHSQITSREEKEEEMREKDEYSSKGISSTTARNLGPEENESSFTFCDCSASPCTPIPLLKTACSEGERGGRRGRQLNQRASSEHPPSLSSRSYPAPQGRRRMADYEKEFTFRPKLTLTSVRMAARMGHDSVPLLHRLYSSEKKPPNAGNHHINGFTFAPKLNRLSLQLAKQREARLPEVRGFLVDTYAKNSFQKYN